eukprot:GCRY01000870.1.p1 GENE.GCRY01000870.1~~GCRY01000870.1.p1  ORF type:complete len:273 (+),score=78.26 GCRY01000870.1:22-819(+)
MKYVIDAIAEDYSSRSLYLDGDKLAVARLVDHTLLKPGSTDEAIRNLCGEAVEHKFRSVCIPPSQVKVAASALEGHPEVSVCTVIGFPLGYNTIEMKVAEAKQAVLDGADEVDYVENIKLVKEKKWEELAAEGKAIVEAVKTIERKNLVQGRDAKEVVVKVILETCLLTEEEIFEASVVSCKAGVHIVKTSTGFSTHGAKEDAIKAMRRAVEKVEKDTGLMHGIKASGGVRTPADARTMAAAGATRLGTSAGVALMQDKKAKTDY